MAFGTDDNQEQKPAEGTDQTPNAPGTPATPEVPAEVLKKIEHQDAFIEKLKTEAAARDEKLIELLEKQATSADQRITKEDITSMLNDLKSKPADNTQEPSPEKEISIEEITASVGDKLKEEALAVKRASNLKSSMEAAEAVHGEKFEEIVIEAAVKRGMSLKQLNDMAENSPQVFAELFVPKTPPNDQPDTTNSNSVAGFDRSRAPERKSIRNMSTNNRAAYIKQLMDSQK